MAKATKKQALGRGLSALLKDPENDIKSASDKNADKVVGNIIELDLEFIVLLSSWCLALYFMRCIIKCMSTTTYSAMFRLIFLCGIYFLPLGKAR